MDAFLQQARSLWIRWLALSLPRKMSWALGVGACFTFAGLIYWATQPEYRVLYSGLSAEEAGAITTKLQSRAIPYKLTAGGSTILVPFDQALQVHIDLTSDGTPGSSKLGKGLDLFDQPMIGATPFNQHVNFLRAQQSELARTIMQIDPVVYTRVHIVKPEPSPFIRDQKPTTASVMVKLRPGATLNRTTVAGIVALVAGSVEGLTRDNVRIIDASGRLLSDQRDPDSGMIGSVMEQRKEVEQYLASEAEKMLAHVMGPGRAIVRVTVDMNTKHFREKKEIINAEGRVTKTEKTTVNKTNSNAAGKSGPVGSTSNLGRGGPASSGGGGVNSTQETQQSDYDYPRTFQEIDNKHGSIERLTVAAFVDPSTMNGDQPMTVAEVTEIIKKAVGFKADRDEIQVNSVKMPTLAPVEFPVEDNITAQRWQTVLSIVRYVSMGMVALCAFPIIWALFRRRIAPPTPATAPSAAPQVDKMKRLSEALERNPEGLAKVLTQWIERSETADRKAA
jgi:flagellar M-ring protein FliF